METAPGLVGVMVCGVDQTQLVKVNWWLALVYVDLHAVMHVTVTVAGAAIHCPPIESIIDNGEITYSPQTTPQYDLNTVATYSCNSGYYLVGSMTRICAEDLGGTWSNETPMCVGK